MAGAGVVLGRGVLEPGLKFAPPDLEPSPVARGWQFAPEADVPAADAIAAVGAFAIIAGGIYAGLDLNNYRQTGKKGLFTGMGADAGNAIGEAYSWDPSIGQRTSAEGKIYFDQYLGWKAIDIMAGPIPDAMSASKSATTPATLPPTAQGRKRLQTFNCVVVRRCMTHTTTCIASSSPARILGRRK